MPDHTETNQRGGAASHPDASSPANGSGPADGVETEPPGLPFVKHRKASSVHTTSPSSKSMTIDDTSAAAALERAIKSSPHKFHGTQHVPIEVEDDLTPQPTRRVLFPSPTQSEDVNSRRNSMVQSIGCKDNRPSRRSRTNSLSQANKENCPPQTEQSELNQIFEGDHQPLIRSTTPTPASSNRGTTLKTPNRSPSRLPPTTGDFFSSAAKALLRPPSTPKRTPTKDSQPLGEMTPFTAHLNQLLSDANNGSPGSQNFDFPSLPSLRNTPGKHAATIDFNLLQFDSQELISTDVPMPSSPPAWFGVYEDPIEHDSKSLWGNYHLPNSASTPDGEPDEGNEPKTPGFTVDKKEGAGVEFRAMA